jgi:hypothetical protein
MISDMSSSTTWRWPNVGAETFAIYNELLGQSVVLADGVQWRAVRPFFFIPLLPYETPSSGVLKGPHGSRWGGLQYAVPAGETPNSSINVSMFQELKDYSVQALDYNRRRQIRLAERHFEIRPVTDMEAFCRQLHPVYCDFYRRTRYAYGSRRRDPVFFRRWAEALFNLPGLVILGGYRGEGLGGVSISMRVDEVLVYTTFFCDTESMRRNLSDLMLHSVRSALAASGEAQAIYVGSYHGRKNDFYALRGAHCVSLPARLRLNPLAEMALKRFNPRAYDRLLGKLDH